MELLHSKSILIRLALIIPLLWVILSYLYITTYTTHLQENLYEKNTQLMKTQLHALIEEKAEVISVIATSVALNPTVKNIILNNEIDKSIVQYSHSFATNSSLKNIWIHVVDKNGISRYRSWTKKKGDSIRAIRLDVARILQHPKIYSGISVGQFDMTFKSMVPMFENKKFIGFVEVVAKFNSISKKMRNRGYESVFLVEDKYKDQLTHPFTKRFIDNHYIANIDVNETMLKLIKKIGIKKVEDIKDYTVYDNQLITNYRLNDVNGNYMASVILMKKVTALDQKSIIQSRNRLILIAFLIFIAIVGIVYYVYVIHYRKFINKINKELEDEVVRKTEELQHLAHHDVLTQLPNRVYFNQYLEDALKHAKRNGTNVSVLFLDLDKFKEVNDTFGHGAGDKLLVYIAKELKNILREMDFVARLGGDEFIIVVENVDATSLAIMCHKLIDTLHKKIVIDGNEMPVSFSIGVSSYPEDAQNAQDLLRNADTAMYKAKNLGKDRFEFYNKLMTEEIQERFNLVKRINKALKNSEFMSYFQPKIDSRSGKVTGLEGLIRWEDPKNGFIAPDHFIPLAEESNLIIQIDEWMIENSLKIVSQWHKKGLFDGRLSLNVSSRQMEQENFIDYIAGVIEKTACESSLVEIEITERQLVKDKEHIAIKLKELREMGIKVSIDDFGTGYSSLSYLKDLPVDVLKIDKSFTDTILHDKTGEAVVKSIITLAENLHMQTIAEGAESKEQVEFLTQNGCYNIQGYYYSKPLSQKECELYLKNN